MLKSGGCAGVDGGQVRGMVKSVKGANGKAAITYSRCSLDLIIREPRNGKRTTNNHRPYYQRRTLLSQKSDQKGNFNSLVPSPNELMAEVCRYLKSFDPSRF